jgi:hypothetical protein
LLLFQELALGAMAVVARVVSLLFESAMGARVNVSAQIAGTTVGNIIKRFGLDAAQTPTASNPVKAGV